MKKVALLIILSVMICSAGVGAVDPVKYKPKAVPVLHAHLGKVIETMFCFIPFAVAMLLVGGEAHNVN